MRRAVVCLFIMLGLVCLGPDRPAASSTIVRPLAQLTPPATIRVCHDARNTLWTDWPVGEMRVFDFEDYIKHVIPYEVPPSWPAEALKAQAVAARTYGWYKVLHPMSPTCDVSNYANTQMMGPSTFPSTNAAVEATRGQYIAYAGQIILAQFSAENGDPTLDAVGVPYLRGIEDPISFGRSRNGHGHGMSQWGAYRWAAWYGWDYQKILMHYYTGVSVELPAGALPDGAPPLGSVVFPWSGWYFTGSRMFVQTNATDAASGVNRADFSACFANGLTTTLGSATAGWAVGWDVSAVADQPISAPIVLSATLRDVAGNTGAALPAVIGLDRVPPTLTVGLAEPHDGGPTITLRLDGGDVGSGLAGVALSNDWVWEGEALPRWTGSAISDTAALNGSAWRARAGVDAPGNVYGPWMTGLAPGQYRAYFRLKTTGVLTTAVIARLDVVTTTNRITTPIGLHDVRGGDFRVSGEYQEFAVQFWHRNAGDQLEFRTHFLGVADLYLDRVLVVAYPVPFATRVAWQLDDGPLPKTVRVKALDAAGNVSPDGVVIVGNSSSTPTTTPTATTPTATATATPASPTVVTATPTASPTASDTPATGTPTATATPTVSVTASPTKIPWSPTLTATQTASATKNPWSPTPTATTTPTDTPTATGTPTTAYTKTPSPTSSPTPTVHVGRVFLPVTLAAFVALPTSTRTPGPTPECTLGVVATFAVGREPHGIAVAPGRLYVSNFTGIGQPGTVSVLDSSTGEPVAGPIPVGRGPNGAAYNPHSGMVYVANRDTNDVSVIDTRLDRVVATVPVGNMPNGVVVSIGTNRVYVANWGSNDVSVIDGASNTSVGRIGVGSQPAMIAADQDRGLVYVTNYGSGSVSVIRSSDNAVIRTIGLASLPAPYGITVNPVANRIYVAGIVAGRMAIIDGQTGTVLATTAPPGGMQPWQVAANAATNHVVVASSGGSGRVYIYDAEHDRWIGKWPVGQRPEQGIALDRETGRVYVANSGSDSVTVIQDCPTVSLSARTR